MSSETSLPTCYRHPDRETRLSCTVCERPICTECMTTASVGHRCPDCAKPSGDARTMTAAEAMRRGGSVPFTKGVIGACVVVFVVVWLTGQQSSRLFLEGAQYNAAVAAGEYWRLLTAMFLHSPGFLLHIVFNMLLLWMLGPQIEREVGPVAFASLYLGSGLLGSAIFFLFAEPQAFAVGASGAVFGLFGAWLASGVRNRHTLQGRAMLRQIGPLVLLNLGISFLPRIAWQAHIGGFVAGFVIAFVWWRFRPDQNRARAAVGAAVAAVAVLAVVLSPGPLV